MGKETMKEIMEKLETGVRDFFTSDKMKDYLMVMSKFYQYSPNNCILIASQCPWATRVAGYKKWQSLERHVRKGAKAIKILAPYKYKIDIETKNEQGELIKEKREFTSFRLVNVFDISQTDGKELPQLITEMKGDVDQYDTFMAAIQEAAPYPIQIEEIVGTAKGYCSYTDNKIVIREGMSQLQSIKTGIHETAHARIHQPEKSSAKSREQKEVEAEAVAYVVCAHYNLDTSDYSFGYVASWASGEKTDILKASLETIQKEAGAIIDDIDNAFERFASPDGMSKRDLEQNVQKTVIDALRTAEIPAEPVLTVITDAGSGQLDVTVEFQGEVREEDLTNYFEKADISVGGKKLNVKPVKSQKGSVRLEPELLDDLLKKEERKEIGL